MARFIGPMFEGKLAKDFYLKSRVSSPFDKCGESLIHRRHLTVKSSVGNKLKEIEIPILNGKVAAKAWGTESAFPVLALHGWQNNCGTFDRLILVQATKRFEKYIAVSQLRIGARCFALATSNKKPLEWQEIQIPIPGGNVAAKAWGSKDAHPVLAFHGWLDNCGTFDKLLPLLSDQFYYVAIDAPGHGKSHHKPPGCVYTDISMVMDFKRVVDSLGWKNFHILGHSLGAVLGLLFSSIFPEHVQKLMLLDASKPYSTTEDLVPRIKIAGIKEHLKCECKMFNQAPVYSPDAAANRLMKGMHNEVNEEGIEILLKRGSKKSDCGTGVVFTRDLRMRPLEVISVRSHDTTESLMSALKCKLLVIMANNTNPNYLMDPPEMVERFLNFYKKTLKHCFVCHVDGNHFVHLNNPETVAPIINKFLLCNNVDS